jgi:hypothetical protein
LPAEFVVGVRADPGIRFGFRVSGKTASVSTAAFSVQLPADAGRLPRKKALMPAPISTNKRKTVDTGPVLTGCDLIDWAASTVIYFLPRDNRPPYQSRGFSARSLTL